MREYPMADGVTISPLDLSLSVHLTLSTAIARWGQGGDGRYLHAKLRDGNMIDLSKQTAAAIQPLIDQLTHIGVIDMGSKA